MNEREEGSGGDSSEPGEATAEDAGRTGAKDQRLAVAIKHWPSSERPRERLVAQGPAALSDAELLAVLLGSGCSGNSALDCARLALQRFGSLSALLNAPPRALQDLPGWGMAGITRLRAVVELGKRMLLEQARRPPALSSPGAARDYLRLLLSGRPHEIFTVLFLDAQHRLIACEEMFRGTLTQTSVYPREIVKQALHHNCAAVILAHNHPSGVAEPSRADEALTRALQGALALVDVRVLDHIVVAGASSTSFAERGLL
jgi:DNA repair protein RadC